MNITKCEDVWIEATLNDNSFLVIGEIYKHPRPTNYINFSHAFQNNLLNLKNKLFVVLGDFNIDYGFYNINASVKKYVDNITSIGCEQLITWQTRISPNRQSIIDHIFVGNSILNKVLIAAVIEHDISDHFPLILQT